MVTQTQTIQQKPTLTEEELIQFGYSWFDKLNQHTKVEELLKMVSDTNLEMVFPEQTIQNHDDFCDWYDVVGKTYYAQDHTIKKFDIQISDAAKIDVVVVWRAKQLSDDRSLAVRVTQTWVVTNSLTNGLPVITNYKIHSFANA